MSKSTAKCISSDEITDGKLPSSKLKVVLSFATGAFCLKAVIALLPTCS